mgnify:CR=1 FL=1
MATLWRWFVSILIWLSADPDALVVEAPKAAAAVSAARASMERDRPAPPAPPAPGKCCGECRGTGVIVHGDGHRTPCPCPASCKCKAASCPDGRCPKGV